MNFAVKIDKAPCLDVIYLPAQIDRDVSYAANQLIIVDKTKVNCLADVNLRVGIRLEVRDTFRISQSCALPPTVYVDQGLCPDVNHTAGFSQQSTPPYVYDASGNTTYDPHKKLTIQYNYLNLPYKVIGNEQDTLYNLYAADGSLLQRKYSKQCITLMKVDFMANKEWHKDTLRLIHHNDGRVILRNGTYNYEYNIKDHLGNVRTTFSDSNNDNAISSAERRSKNDYYSFGMEHFDPHQGSEYKNPENRYLYNGKEMIGEMDYNVLDFGQRLADPALGRFATLDRFSTKYAYQNGYTHTGNNPLKFIDVNGDSLIIRYNGTSIFYRDGKLYYRNGEEYNGRGTKMKNGKIELTGFLKSTVDALKAIGNGGREGNDLMQSILNDSDFFIINEGESNGNRGRMIYFNPKIRESGLNEAGNKKRPSYIGLAHEMAHSLDWDDGSVDISTWITYSDGSTTSKAEYFSTHIENLIRAENNLPLRLYYGSDGETNVGQIIKTGTTQSLLVTKTVSLGFGYSVTIPYIY